MGWGVEHETKLIEIPKMDPECRVKSKDTSIFCAADTCRLWGEGDCLVRLQLLSIAERQSENV